jgi:hypothetical protein
MPADTDKRPISIEVFYVGIRGSVCGLARRRAWLGQENVRCVAFPGTGIPPLPTPAGCCHDNMTAKLTRLSAWQSRKKDKNVFNQWNKALAHKVLTGRCLPAQVGHSIQETKETNDQNNPLILRHGSHAASDFRRCRSRRQCSRQHRSSAPQAHCHKHP